MTTSVTRIRNDITQLALHANSPFSEHTNRCIPLFLAQVLGVRPRAGADDIRAAYKSLAKQWHPDLFQGAKAVEAEKRFQEIAEAFQVLSDPEQRKIYDTELAVAKDAEARRKAAQRFRATSWNTPVVNVQERLRNAKREEPGSANGMVAAACLFVTVNFVLVFRFLAG